jgi:hypothetical protein
MVRTWLIPLQNNSNHVLMFVFKAKHLTVPLEKQKENSKSWTLERNGNHITTVKSTRRRSENPVLTFEVS